MYRSRDKGAAAVRDADFELIADSIPHVVFMATPDGSTEYFNQRGAEYTGLTRAANDGWNWLALLHPEDADPTVRAWRDAVARQAPFAVEYRLRRHDGAFRWHECHALPVRNADGELVKWVGTVTDIEDRRRLEDSLREAERQTAESVSLLDTLQSTAVMGLGFVDRDFRQVRMNEALAVTNGIPVEQQLGRTVAEVVPELWPQLEPLYRRVLETGQPVVAGETCGDLPGDSGVVHTWLTSLYPVRVEGEVIGIAVVVVDVTARKALELQLKDAAERDPLTDIYNRRQLFIELDRALRYASRYNHAGAVLVLDVDNFKWINDSCGHAAGDGQLKAIAQVLARRLRDTDILARLGGDEFALVLPEATREQAIAVALQLRAVLSQRAPGPPVQVSVGIALFGEGQQLTADEVLAAADMAMYQAKEAGGDQAVVYDGPPGDLLLRLRNLREALAEKRFVLYGQPIIDLRGGQVAKRELLIRMLSDSGEIIPPGSFLSIAERFSLVGEMDRWVVGQALALAHHEAVSVNLSARSVGDPRILEAVHDAVAAGLDPGHLTFEITETAVMSDFETALAFVTALKDLGCDLALDDFGTGFASFTYLKHLAARYLKIDMDFVRDINDDPTDKEIVRSIVGIAHTLDKETVAEGVESAAVLETLRELGVDYAQGFYIGAPAPVAQPTAQSRISPRAPGP